MLSARWLRAAGSIALGVVAAILTFLGLLQWQHWRQDEAAVHALIGVINYNLQQGRLVLPPLPTAATPAPASLPTPATSPPKP